MRLKQLKRVWKQPLSLQRRRKGFVTRDSLLRLEVITLSVLQGFHHLKRTQVAHAIVSCTTRMSEGLHYRRLGDRFTKSVARSAASAIGLIYQWHWPHMPVIQDAVEDHRAWVEISPTVSKLVEERVRFQLGYIVSVVKSSRSPERQPSRPAALGAPITYPHPTPPPLHRQPLRNPASRPEPWQRQWSWRSWGRRSRSRSCRSGWRQPQRSRYRRLWCQCRRSMRKSSPHPRRNLR